MATGQRSITISGFKSIYEPQSLVLGKLTVLAGANSSGKSSVVQPLLMLKQTLESSFDPGSLLLDGPNVKFTSVDQMFSLYPGSTKTQELAISFSGFSDAITALYFQKAPAFGLNLDRVETKNESGHKFIFKPGTTISQDELGEYFESVRDIASTFIRNRHPRWTVVRDRCFVGLVLHIFDGPESTSRPVEVISGFLDNPTDDIRRAIESLIHVPGLRGNPERDYPLVALGNRYPGTFQNYVASIIHGWKDKDDKKLIELGNALEELELTWKVDTRRIRDTKVELRVGRLIHGRQGGAHDLVNIADVGYGLSQVMPVLIALLESRPGQLVYIEQPEIHLHPKAQLKLASLLVAAANRGVNVIVETHSSLLLRGIQTSVAGKYIEGSSVALHWFSRDPHGHTKVALAHLDENGAFGDWPEDFDEVYLGAESEYLDAGLFRR